VGHNTHKCTHNNLLGFHVTPKRYGGILGISYNSVRNPYKSVQSCTESIRVGFWVFSYIYIYIYIYIIDVNLHYYQNNSRLSVDVDILSNHVKSMPLSLDLFFFDSIYCSSLLCAVTTIFQLIRPE
jgi:hypothetical protein